MSLDRIFTKEFNTNNYLICEYYLESETDLASAAYDIAIGQSIGNPEIRNEFESDKLIQNHCCLILHNRSELSVIKKGHVKIAFPLINIDLDNDGISQLLCFIQGGHTDINRIQICQVRDITFPEQALNKMSKAKFGISGMRKFLDYDEKPFLGCILKPKTGLDINTYKKLIRDLIDEGANFIKEDEILSSPHFLPLELRVKAFKEVVGNKKVIFAFCINSDPHKLKERLDIVERNGGNAVHINIWSGLGSYHAIKMLNPNLFVFYQKSGIATISDSRNPYSISWPVLVKLGIYSGIDAIHVGMTGGYSNDDENELALNINELQKHNVIPSLSCGFHPGLVDSVTAKFGNDYIANVGGAIYGHPDGHIAGVRAMRQAIDKTYGSEYERAIEKWGKH